MSSNGHDPPFPDRENGHKKIRHYHDEKCIEISGKVVLMKSKILDVNSVFSSIIDRFDESVGHGVTLQLVSSDSEHGDAENGGTLENSAKLEDWIKKITPLTADDITFNVTFVCDKELGLPGAVIVKNEHHAEFYLKTLTLENVPAHGRVHFVCNSWVYPADNYNYDRIFFSNKTCLPNDTPIPLRKYREGELLILRGNGEAGELHPWDRVYDYAYYNDLGNPDKGSDYVRTVLGGSSAYPYPRRGRTNRRPSKTDPKTESRLPALKTLQIYVPRDERFGHLKMSDAVAYGIKSLYQFLYPEAKGLFDGTSTEFESFEQVMDVYEGGLKVNSQFLDIIKDSIPVETVKELVRSDGEHLFKFPMPDIIKVDKSEWRSDEEFAREMLAGINPVVIRRLQEFPPTSKLDPKVYGCQTSSITEDQIKASLYGLPVEEAIKLNKLFILDHHDDIMPFIDRINLETSYKGYATRTILFLKDDGTLMPVAIELSLPNTAVSQVCTPSENGVKRSVWELAKAYVAVNDSAHHQLVSHWLKTHATIEPFIIATNRQLSAMHPIYKLLHPHFRDTMNVNALAREILINAGGALQYTLFTEKYSMEFSSSAYKSWVFPDQALPADLIKRGMAVECSKCPHGIRLMINDYPYAVDGLEIWGAIKTWVTEYCTFYYKTDKMVKRDLELQSWWHEVRTVGHGDKKNEPWWSRMHNIRELIETCTTIIWLASAYHAAINFGQYPFGGYLPNRPSISRRYMPQEKTPEYTELESEPEKVYFKTITAKLQTLLGISLIEVLSRHTVDEVYLGQRESPEWTCDLWPLQAFEKFGTKLKEIESRILEMNNDVKLKNRTGPVQMPYTLLVPSSEAGLTGRGIPNSVSI